MPAKPPPAHIWAVYFRTNGADIRYYTQPHHVAIAVLDGKVNGPIYRYDRHGTQALDADWAPSVATVGTHLARPERRKAITDYLKTTAVPDLLPPEPSRLELDEVEKFLNG